MPIFILLGILIILIAGARLYRKKRKWDMERFAAEAGLPFDLFATGLPDLKNSDPPSLLRDNTGKSSCLIAQQALTGRAFYFDLTRLSGGRGADHENITLALFELPLPLPQMQIYPAYIFTADFPEIKLDRYPALSNLYRIAAPAPAAADALLTPGLVAFLEQNPHWTLQTFSRYLLVFQKRTFVPLSGYRDFIENTSAIAALFADDRSIDSRPGGLAAENRSDRP